MIEQPNPLSLTRQCQLLGLSRAALYYRPVEVSADELELMTFIDRQYLRTPFYGSRRMTAWLRTKGHLVNRKRVQRLMGLMGLEAIYQRPHTSRPAPEHRTYPYLLRGLVIERVNQVWAADITYIPMACGFLYLVAVMDWVSRYVLAWRLSNLLDASFCIDALDEALSQGRPEIFNTDQGSQFTDEDFTSVLCAHGVAISMDGRGRFSDNIFVERLWRSLKFEEVYLKAYQNVAQARRGIVAYFNFL
jgi:putative transposase